MDTKLPALLRQPPLTSSQAHSAHSSEAAAQTANALKTTPQPLESQNLEPAAAAKALFPVVMAMPQDYVLQSGAGHLPAAVSHALLQASPQLPQTLPWKLQPKLQAPPHLQ